MEARTRDLSGMTGQLRGFDLDEYLGEGTESKDIVAWAVGDDAVPDRCEVGPLGHIAAAAAVSARVLLVMDYARDTNKVLTETRKMIERALPGSSVDLRASFGPFEDDEGIASHFDGAVGRPCGPKRVKRIRVDLLTSCAKVLRDSAAFLPDLVIGFGQGAVVSALIRWPLVVQVYVRAAKVVELKRSCRAVKALRLPRRQQLQELQTCCARKPPSFPHLCVRCVV